MTLRDNIPEIAYGTLTFKKNRFSDNQILSHFDVSTPNLINLSYATTASKNKTFKRLLDPVLTVNGYK